MKENIRAIFLDLGGTFRIVEENRLGRVFRIESRVQGSRGIPGDWRKEKGHGGGMADVK